MPLVSLCNVQSASAPCLLEVDLETAAVRPVSLEHRLGATGICRLDGHVVVALQGEEGEVAVLDADSLEETARAPLPGARDVHSVSPWSQGIAVASSGTNEVRTYDFDGSAFRPAEVVWSDGDPEEDRSHVNGLTARGEHLICCAFGPRRSSDDLWGDARSGYVLDITTGSRVACDLAHPHSPSWLDGELVFCESAWGAVRNADETIAALDGYTRGIAPYSPHEMIVGTSLARDRSRSTGRLLSPGDAGSDAGTCALHVVGRDGTVLRSLSLAPYGREIYDVLP